LQHYAKNFEDHGYVNKHFISSMKSQVCHSNLYSKCPFISLMVGHILQLYNKQLTAKNKIVVSARFTIA